jgi:hypothetical protein
LVLAPFTFGESLVLTGLGTAEGAIAKKADEERKEPEDVCFTLSADNSE